MSNQQWEYRYDAYQVSESVKTIQQHLDGAGDEGWEAVGIAVDQKDFLHVLLKRPKSKPLQDVTQTRYKDARLTSGRRAR